MPMQVNPIQEIFKTSWMIQREGIHRIHTQGTLSCSDLEQNFRSLYKDCLDKLDETYNTIRMKTTEGAGNEYLELIKRVRSALCNKFSFHIQF